MLVGCVEAIARTPTPMHLGRYNFGICLIHSRIVVAIDIAIGGLLLHSTIRV
jgi:hypothetical protein